MEISTITTASETLVFLRDLAAEIEIKVSWKHTELRESLNYLRDDPTQLIWPNVLFIQQELIELRDHLYSLRQQIHDLEESIEIWNKEDESTKLCSKETPQDVESVLDV